jgi:hypothetical protein
LNQLLDFHKIQQEGHAIEGDISAMIFNPLASVILKRRTFRLLGWMQDLHLTALDYDQGNHTILVWLLKPYLCNIDLFFNHCNYGVM